MPTDKQAIYICSMCGGSCTVVDLKWTCGGCLSTGYFEAPPTPLITGVHLRDLRKSMNWSRRELSELTDIPQHRIVRIENNTILPTQEESKLFEKVFFSILENTLDSDTKSKKVNLIKHTDGVVRTASWNGYTRGDLVKITQERGLFRFLYHHIDNSQEYIEVVGPVQGRPKTPPLQRSFSIDRIIPVRIKNND
jgi:transcriptional regulator with XRE-family HTH domain